MAKNRKRTGFFGRRSRGTLGRTVGNSIGDTIGSTVGSTTTSVAGSTFFSSLVSALVPVAVATVAVSTVWSVHTESISIVRDHIREDDRWSVVFTELYSVDKGNLVNSSVRTAMETQAPTLSDSTISAFAIEMGTPGDFISYRFRIKNTGNLPAKVATFSPVNSSYITCEPRDGSKITATKANDLCNHLILTMKYVDSGYSVETNDYFAPEDEREVELKLVYSQNINENDIPDDDVKITVSEISIPFMQAD